MARPRIPEPEILEEPPAPEVGDEDAAVEEPDPFEPEERERLQRILDA
jgi:hypothetical protein